MKCSPIPDSFAPTHHSLGFCQVAGWDLYRKLTSRVANFLAHTLLSPGVTDLTGSYRLFSKAALEDIMKEVTSKGAGVRAGAVTSDDCGCGCDTVCLLRITEPLSPFQPIRPRGNQPLLLSFFGQVMCSRWR